MLDDAMQRSEITPDDWVLGRPDAPATLLEYGDFECPFCAMARPVLEEVVADNPDTIRLVFRHFPITSIHPHALQAAEAAEAAGAQGKFWEMHDRLFTHQSEFDYVGLLRHAMAIGLRVEQFDREMRAHTYLEEVRVDFRRGIEDGVNGTPTIFINGVRYDGPRERTAMLAAIEVLTSRRRAVGE
jgi:protein-disulfide isomerase